MWKPWNSEPTHLESKERPAWPKPNATLAPAVTLQGPMSLSRIVPVFMDFGWILGDSREPSIKLHGDAKRLEQDIVKSQKRV